MRGTEAQNHGDPSIRPCPHRFGQPRRLVRFRHKPTRLTGREPNEPLPDFPPGRPAAAPDRRLRTPGRGTLFRLGSRRCGRTRHARRQAGSRRRRGKARTENARRPALRQRPDLLPGPGRQPARRVSRPHAGGHAVPAHPQHLGLSHRRTGPGPRRPDGRRLRQSPVVLHEPARFSHQRLHARANERGVPACEHPATTAWPCSNIPSASACIT